jgi:hypothetical protein
MTSLNIQATDRTPEISIEGSPPRMRISGESFPEDVAAFYGPVVFAVESLVDSLTERLHVEINLVYVNSSSIKALYRIFEGISEIHSKNLLESITWFYPDDDDILQELGEDFKDRFPDLPFQIEITA